MACGQEVPNFFWMKDLAVPAVVSLVTALVVTRWETKDSERREIHADITKMIEFSMQYPHVEDPNFTRIWEHKDVYSDKEIIYDNYCCFVFNVLERIWNYYNGDKKKIIRKNNIHVAEIASSHSKWWFAEKCNIDGYKSKEFKEWITELAEKGTK